MSKRIKQITAENFAVAVDYACTLNKKMHANVLAKKIVLPLGSFVFALHSIVMLLGALYMLVQDNVSRVIAFHSIKFIINYWNGIWNFCQNVSELIYVQVILMVLYLFLVPFAISSIAAIIIFYIAKGKELVIKGDTAKKAKQLHEYLDKAPRTYFEAFDGSPVLWRRTSGIISGILIIIFMFYYYGCILNQSNDFLSAFSVLFQSNENSEDIIVCIIFGGLFYVPYAILHYIFTLMLQPYCDSYNKWKKLIDKVEHYWLSVDKEECKRREEAASREDYDGWKYKSLEKTQYYKDKSDEYYAKYMGIPYETDEDKAKRLVSEVEDELSGGGWGNY